MEEIFILPAAAEETTGDEEFTVIWMLLVMLCMSAAGVWVAKRRVM